MVSVTAPWIVVMPTGLPIVGAWIPRLGLRIWYAKDEPPPEMTTPGKVPKPVVILFGPNRSVALELFVETEPEYAPFGSVPPAPGGVEFTLMVSSRPAMLTFVPVPVDTMLPKFTMLGVATPEPEPVL